MSTDRPPIPVSVITGFLGSGKTTLLGRLLHKPAMSDTAVIINEFGEIGLDHQLIEAAEGDIVMMSSGCLCCTIRSSLVDTLRNLFEKSDQGRIGRFRRVLIETTGLADPAPILQTLMQEPYIKLRYGLDSVVATVDALHGEGQLAEHVESVKQAAVADRILLTKTDLAPAEQAERIRRRLKSLNPAAPVVIAVQGDVEPAVLFDAGLYDPAARSSDVTRWLNAESYLHDHDRSFRHAHDFNRHDARIQAHCLVFDEPLNWRYFSPNLASLVSRHAEKLLRVKGLLNIAGEPQPVVVHGVQQEFHRLRLAAWPDADRRSKLVLITRDLERDFLRDWLQDRMLSGAPARSAAR